MSNCQYSRKKILKNGVGVKKRRAISSRSLDLPERPELPERPPKYRKDQRIIGKY